MRFIPNRPAGRPCRLGALARPPAPADPSPEARRSRPAALAAAACLLALAAAACGGRGADPDDRDTVQADGGLDNSGPTDPGSDGSDDADRPDGGDDPEVDAGDGTGDGSGDDAASADAEDAGGDAADAGDPSAWPIAPNASLGARGLVLLDAAGDELLAGSWAEALVDGASYSTRGCDAPWKRTRVPGIGHASVAGGLRECDVGDGLSLLHSVGIEEDGRLVVALTLLNGSELPVTVQRLSPIVSERRDGDGGLYLGASPGAVRVLDDGHDLFLDIDVRLRHGDEQVTSLILALLPIRHRGQLVSNWNHALVDLSTGEHLIVGALSVERAIPTFGLVAGAAPSRGDDIGFAGYYADQSLPFAGKAVPAGGALDAEDVLVDLVSGSAHEALERYAAAVALHVGRLPWTEARPVPNGWNSWTGSSSTGGLGTAIDQDLMREELAIMAREFAPFGVDYFQVDDGWMQREGDWTANERFADGLEDLFRRVRDAGLVPGLWASLFLARTDSELAAAHPEWLLPPENDVTRGAYSPGRELRPLDFSNPEVVAFVRDTAARFSEDFGLGWFKLDFAYFVTLHHPVHDPSLTTVEAYRRGLAAVREGLGDEVFLLGIGQVGTHWGYADGMRTTLDDGPTWEEDDPFVVGGTGNTLKNAVRNGSRRWYLHGNLWVNHNDLLFFRTDTSRPETPLTFTEARTFAAWIALSGSIVKFGEDLRTLTPEQIRLWRRLLPVYGPAARPLDVFERMYPERFVLRVDGGRAGWDTDGWVLGLFNWGRNWDYSGARRRVMADAPRTLAVARSELELDEDVALVAHELWTWRFLGPVGESVALEVPPHDSAIVAVRRASGTPQLLATDRHVTQGATDVISESWPPGAGVLTVRLRVDAGPEGAVPMPVRVRVGAPAGYLFQQVRAASGSSDPTPIAASTTVEHGWTLIDLVLEPEAPGELTLTYAFGLD